MSKPYQLSACVVAYQTPPGELAELLRSLLAGSRLRVLATVVDNSPTEALRSTVEATGAIYLHSGSNIGFGPAHNIALRRNLPQADYQVVVNPDIALQPATLEALYDFMQAHPHVGQVMPGIRYPDGTEQRLTKRLPSPGDLFLRRFLGNFGKRLAPHTWARYEMRDLDMQVTRQVPCLSGCFMFLRSAVLEQVGLFDERYFMYMEDVDLCRRIGDVSQTVFYPAVTVTHGYTKASYRSNRLLGYHLKSAVRYFAKWGWLLDPVRKQRNHQTGAL